MNRIFVILLMSLGLVACSEQGPSLEGKWGWFTAEACEADRDTIEFAGTEFMHRRQGEVAVQGTDLAYRQTDAAGGARLTAVYGFNGRVFELTFEPSVDDNGGDILIFRGSAIDGVSPPAAAQAAGRQLYRCN